MKGIQLCFVIALIWGCGAKTSSSDSESWLTEISSPAGESAQPNLFVMDDGRPILSWVEYLNDTTDALMFSVLNNNKWSKGKIVAQGSDWFVNWADFPSMAVFPGSSESMAAHWLQKSANGVFDYDVRIAQSNDGGDSWGESFIIHRDSLSAEHGFVTMLPVSEDRLFATWLDGRNTRGNESAGSGGGGHHGAMTIRAAQFDRNGNLYEEYELDARTCDCCQTDAALTSQGLVVVYRDRSEEEIRDIYIVREQASAWTKPVPVHNDGWEIAGCPVNGPAIAAQGEFIALAWYTESDQEPKLLLALSRDAGASFSKPVRIDNGNPLGRADISILENGTSFVTWLEKGDEGAHIIGAYMDKNGRVLSKRTLLASEAARRSGFPILESTKDGLLLAWTYAGGEETTVRTGIIPYDRLVQ
jgi:hypothetical protein